MKSASQPRLACEILPDRVVAARAAEHGGHVELYTTRTIPAGTIVPNLATENIADRVPLLQAISDCLAAVGDRSREIIAVIPDAAVRVFLLDFDALPDRPQEAASVVRFRLRKSLPFDVERARLSYDARRRNGAVRVVAAVASTAVVVEYETLFRDAGYSPGVLLPSVLAALGPVEASQPTLVVKVDAATISVVIVAQDEFRLVRTTENPQGTAIDGAHLAEQIHPSLVFFQDTYAASIQRILLAGVPAPEEVAAALTEQSGARVEPLLAPRYLGSSLSGDPGQDAALAGVVGALLR